MRLSDLAQQAIAHARVAGLIGQGPSRTEFAGVQVSLHASVQTRLALGGRDRDQARRDGDDARSRQTA